MFKIFLLILLSVNLGFSKPGSPEVERICEEFNRRVALSIKLNDELGKVEEDRDKLMADRDASQKSRDEWAVDNWRTLLSDVERLSPQPDSSESDEVAVNTIVSAADSLPAMEYVEFVERLLDLAEAKRITAGPFERATIGPNWKVDFFTVNYQHPKVQKLLQKAKVVFKDDPKTVEWLDHLLSGERADEYMDPNNRSADSPYPETLPGIKLKRPFGKLRAQAERLLGKRLPDDEYDARWKEYDRQWKIRNERRAPQGESLPALLAPDRYESRGAVFWCISGAVVFVVGFVILRLKKSKNR